MRLVELSKLVGAGLSHVCCLVIRGSVGSFLLLGDFSGVVSQPRSLRVSQYVVSFESSSLIYHRMWDLIVLIPDRCLSFRIRDLFFPYVDSPMG